MSDLNVNNIYVGNDGKIQLSGLTSNIDFVDVVDKMIKARRIPADNLENRISDNEDKISALKDMQSKVKAVQNSLATLYGATSFDNSKNVFDSKSVFASSSNGTGTASDAGNLMSVSADNSAAAGTYTFDISQIASKQKIASNTQAVNPGDDVSGLTGTGQFTISTATGTQQFTVGSGDTLQDIRDKVNAATDTTGVQAQVIKVADGQSTLVFTSTQEGSTNRMTLTDDSGTVLQNLGMLVDDGSGNMIINSANEIDQGNDAQFTLDGVSITRSSNDISDLIDGLDISLYDAEPGTKVKIEVEQDLSKPKSAIMDFVDSYNALRSFLNEKTYVDPTTQKAEDGAILLGNSTAKDVESSLQQIAGSTPLGTAGDFSVLAQLGITFTSAAEVSNNNDDKYNVGTLKVDETKLNDALINHPGDVESLFNFQAQSDNPDLVMTGFSGKTQSGSYNFSVTTDASGAITSATYDDGTGAKNATINGNSITTADGLRMLYTGAASTTTTATVNTSVGLGAQLYFAANNMLDEDSGAIPQEISTIQDQNSSYQDKVDRIDNRLTGQREHLLNQFITMEQALAQMKNVQSSLSELMATGKKNNG